MDKFTKDKIKQIKKLRAIIRYELHHVEHLLFNIPTRSLRGKLNATAKIFRASIKIKSLECQIEIIRSTPSPKYPSGGSCGIIDERGPEMVISGCNPNLINPIQSISIQKNKVVRVNDMPLAAHHSMHISLCGPPKK